MLAHTDTVKSLRTIMDVSDGLCTIFDTARDVEKHQTKALESFREHGMEHEGLADRLAGEFPPEDMARIASALFALIELESEFASNMSKYRSNMDRIQTLTRGISANLHEVLDKK